MKRILQAISLSFVVSGLIAHADDPVSRATACFDSGAYRQGLSILSTALEDGKLAAADKARISYAQASFYECYVGSYDKAAAYYRQVLACGEQADAAMQEKARSRIETLAALRREYQAEDRILAQHRVSQWEKTDSVTPEQQEAWKQSARQIEQLIDAHPDYYRLAEVYYYLGRKYMQLGQFRATLRAFDKALAVKPGIDFNLPLSVQRAIAKREFLIKSVLPVCKVSLWAFLILAVASFCFSKVWAWARPIHALAFIATAGIWTLCFYGIGYAAGALFRPTSFTLGALDTLFPSMVRAAPGSPGAHVLNVLFWYGLAGVLWLTVWALSVSRLKSGRKRIMLNVAAALVVMPAVTTLFYLRHCEGQSALIAPEKDAGLLRSSLYFRCADPEPFILTEPSKFRNLEFDRITAGDPEFTEKSDIVGWILQYVKRRGSNP